MRRINRFSHTAKRNGDRRRIDQIRTDIYLQILAGNNTAQTDEANERAAVDIRADLRSLLGYDDQPGEIPGWGPVIADITRQIIGHSEKAEWRVGKLIIKISST